MNETVHIIRKTSRNVLQLNRRKIRNEETDVRRSMSVLRISPTNVSQIANKLKDKSDVTVTSLQTLKNAIINDDSNIEIILNTNGALRGLVRELTGHDVERQCAAAGCCCNLALGDSRAGTAISKAIGPYLIAALDNLTTDLAITCAWTLGNLAGSGNKACSLLASQGAVTKLTQLLVSTDADIQDAALYALIHFAYQLKDEMSKNHLEKIIQALPQVQITHSSSQLLFILSCHDEFQALQIPEEYLQKIVEALPVSIDKYVCNSESEYLLRSLANMNVDHIYKTVLEYFRANNFGAILKELLEKEANTSLLWLLGNLCNLSNDFYVDLVP